MSIDLHFSHRCTIERAETIEDEYHNKRQEWPSEPHLQDVHCRLVEKERVAVNTETGELVSIAQLKLLVPPDTDVVIGDRVSEIILENDERRGPYEITKQMNRRAGLAVRFISLQLREVT